MDELIKLARIVVAPVFTRILAKRRSDLRAGLSLSELIESRTTDTFKQRKLKSKVQSITNAVEERLDLLRRNEFRQLSAGEQAAAASHAILAFSACDLSDQSLFADDMDAERIARNVLEAGTVGLTTLGLSEAAHRFYELLVYESSECLISLITSQPEYSPRTLTVLLDRSGHTEQKLDEVLRRLPTYVPHTSQTDDLDTQFRDKYLQSVINKLDRLNLFGVDIPEDLTRTRLSIAYIGLSARTHREANDCDRDYNDLRRWQSVTGTAPREQVAQIEQILSLSKRILIWGEAGSGKTTLLQWLAVNAATGELGNELSDLNGKVPAFIQLRQWHGKDLPGPEHFLSGIAPEHAGNMPVGFMHRQLETGKALILVDGVDELPSADHPKVREWLSGLANAFPKVSMVVTSRTSLDNEGWLRAEGFAAAELERMSPSDVRQLVRNWHDAIRETSNLPCEPDELPSYENALLAKLKSSPPLQTLATNPLLCALLCALNLHRRQNLPHKRLAVYQDALRMLIHERDAQRKVPNTEVQLDHTQKHVLLRELAWGLSINGLVELSWADAVDRIDKKLRSMPNIEYSAEAVLKYLRKRSGVIREPQLECVDFSHRTFQEFLTADAAADNGNIGLLVRNAHLDEWQETVILAAGLANKRHRENLISGLLVRADKEKRHARRLRILAACCLETLPDLKPQLMSRLEDAISRLLKPRTRAEATSLSRIGEPLLRYLPRDPRKLSEAVASSTVWAAALVNGPQAIEILKGFNSDPRKLVQAALLDAWDYFDPESFAREVLANAPLVDGAIDISNQELLVGVRHLNQLRAVDVSLYAETSLSLLDGVPHLRSLSLYGDFNSVARLKQHQGLELLYLHSAAFFDTSPLAELPRLRHLNFELVTGMNLDFLLRCTSLRDLQVYVDQFRGDLSPLWRSTELEHLTIWNLHPGTHLGEMSDMPKLRGLSLDGDYERPCKVSQALLRALPSRAPNLTHFELTGFDIGDADLTWVPALPGLQSLNLGDCLFDDLRPLCETTALESLSLRLKTATDMAFLAKIPRLANLDIFIHTDEPWHLNLAPFGDRELVIDLPEDTKIYNQGPGITII